MNPYPHQVSGSAWLASRKRACLFDEMGLGKTRTALMALPENPAVVVICPAIAKLVWFDEVKRWRPDLEVAVLSGRGSFRWPVRGEIVVINYDLIDGMNEAPPRINLIADEAHYLKSWTSKRSRAFRSIAAACLRGSGTAWLLTGTPLLRDPYDLWCVLGAVGLHMQVFNGFEEYRTLFGARTRQIVVGTGPKRRAINKIEWGRPAPIVRQKVQAVSLRRTREQVALDIPPKTRQALSVECLDPETRQELDALARRLRSNGIDIDEAIEQAENVRGAEFDQIAKTRKALAILKIKAASELLDNYHSARRKVVLFSSHVAPVYFAAQRPGWLQISGDIPARERERAVNLFQSGQLEGLALTIQAGGTALTLTSASDVVFVDLDWTPALNLQAEDRLCRIGQKQPVQIVILQADHEVERAVNRVLLKKIKMIEALSLG